MKDEGGFEKKEDDQRMETDHAVLADNSGRNIFNYLNEEIAYIRGEHLRPGWTIWALIAAISSLLWLLFGEIGRQEALFKTVIVLYLIGFYVQSTLDVLSSSVDEGGSPIQDHEFRPATFQIRLNPTTWILSILHLFVVIFLTYLLQPQVGLLVSVIAYLHNGYYIAWALVSPAVKRYIEGRRGYIDVSSKYDVAHHIERLFDVTGVYLIYEYVSYAFETQLLIGISDIRIAGLISAILYLAYLLGTIQTKSPILDSLVEIRRDYVLGKIDNEKALKRLGIAISGLQVKDVQTERAELMMQDLESAARELDKAMQQIRVVRRSYKEIGGRISKRDLSRIARGNNVIYGHFMKFSAIMRDRVGRMIINLMDTAYSNGFETLPDPEFIPFVNQIIEKVKETNEKFFRLCKVFSVI